MAFLYAVGTIMSMVGQISAGQQEAKLQQHNAAVYQQQAEVARVAGKIEADRKRRQAREFTATQRATAAALGVVPDVGSPLEVMIADATKMEFDAKLMEWDARLTELNALSGADFSLVRAQQARSSAYMGAGTTLLTAIPTIHKMTA